MIKQIQKLILTCFCSKICTKYIRLLDSFVYILLGFFFIYFVTYVIQYALILKYYILYFVLVVTHYQTNLFQLINLYGFYQKLMDLTYISMELVWISINRRHLMKWVGFFLFFKQKWVGLMNVFLALFLYLR